MKRLPVLAAAALLLSGCSSLSEKECQTADWESVGYNDGTDGRDRSRIDDHVESCSKANIRPDSQSYEEGRQRGLENFCTPRNGLRVGEQGGRYNGVCPVHLEMGFHRGYDIGRDMFDLSQQMQRVQNDLRYLSGQLRSDDPRITERDRDVMIYRLRSLEREYGRMESDYRMLQRRGRDL